MAKASPLQSSFNAGELSPRIEGRVDLAKYHNGCKKLENFIPLVQGGAVKRSGTKFVKEVKDSSAVTRLVSFEFGTTQAYVLEFGNLYMRVYRNDGVVLEPNKTITGATQANPVVITTSASHGFSNGDQVFIDNVGGMTEINNRYFIVANKTGTTFELQGEDGTGHTAYTSGGTVGRVFTLTTPYATADLEALAFAQSADVLYIAHPDYNPRKLERTDHHIWTITSIDFDWQPFADENLDEAHFVIATAETGTVTLVSNKSLFVAGHVNGYIKLRVLIEGKYAPWVEKIDFFANWNPETAAAGSRCRHETNVYELVDSQGLAVAGTAPPIHRAGTEIDGTWYWKYLHSGAGYVKITAVTDGFRATGTVIKQLPRDVVHAGITITSTSEDDPVVVTATNHLFETGDKVFLVDITTATSLNNREFTITKTGVNTFTLDGEDGTGIGVGSGGTAYLVQTGDGPYDQLDRFQRNPHLWSMGAWSTAAGYPRGVTFFEDRLWWAGSSGSPQTIWGSKTSEYEDHEVLDTDDSALQFTINTDQVNVIEWINAGKFLFLGTAGGEFVSANTEPLTPSNPPNIQRQSTYGSKSQIQPVRVENVLLFAQRAGRKLREFVFDFNTESFLAPDLTVLADHILLDRVKKMAFQQEPNRLLWCVLEDGELVCFTYERSQDVTAWHHHPIGGTGVSIESVAVIPHQDGDRDQVWLIVKRTINAATKRYVEYLEEDWLRSNAIASAFFVDSGLTGTLSPAGNTVTGLDHLEGETVKVLADGTIRDDATVSSGSITFSGAAATTVHVGLSYEAVLQQMRLEAGAADGTAQGKYQRITNVVIRLDQTGKGLLVGHTDTDADMEEIKIDDSELIDGDTDILPFPNGYDQQARVTVKHNKPLPCSITAVMPQTVTQDR